MYSKMRLCWLITIIIPLLFQETLPFQWTSHLQDGADVYACVGDTVTFPWNYTVEDGELAEDIKWYYDQGNGSRKGIAGILEGDFFPLRTSFSDRIGHVPKAGLSLTSLTGLDRGKYSVAITVLRGSTFATYDHTVNLIIAEDPLVLENEALWARQERVAVYDNTTGQLHVRLSCGKYVITGQPPVSVEWTFPSGEKHLTSTHINGSFVINLPNPVEGGNYTCRLSYKLPPVSCLPQNASVLRSSSVSVDEVKMRLSLLEAEQEILRTEKCGEIARLSNLADDLQNQLNNTTTSLQQLQNYFNELDSSKVKFEIRLSGRLLEHTGQAVILDNVITNEGQAYNVTTGGFTAPFNGTYFFVVSAYVSQYQESIPWTFASLFSGATNFCDIHSITSSSQFAFGTCQATVHLPEGQKAWLRSNGNIYFSSASFTGISVHQDAEMHI